MENNDYDISDFSYDDGEETENLDACPQCGAEYDNADYDFQICHRCGWDAANNYWSRNSC